MDRGTENDRIVNAFDNIVKKELSKVEKELNRFKKRLGETRLQGSNGNNEKAELWNIAGLLIFGNKSDANNTIQETSEMTSEKSVPGEGAREAELQAAPVTGPSDTSPVTSSAPADTIPEIAEDTAPVTTVQDHIPEIAEDTAPATSTAQDYNIPEIAEDTAPATSTAQGHIPEIAEDTTPASSTAQDNNTLEIAEDTTPATCTAEGHSIPEFAEDESSVTSSAPADNIPEITGETTPVMGPSDTSSVISTAQGQGIPEFEEDEPPDTSSVIPTPPESTVPKDPANSPSTTPASVSPPGEIKIDSVEIDSVSLSWSSPDNMDGIPHSFHITYSSSDKSHQDSITAPSNSTVISELRPGREYSFTVTTVLENGTQSKPVSTSVCTKPSAPGEIKIDSVGSDSVSLSWGCPAGLDKIPHSFKITYSSSVEDKTFSITAVSNSTVISKLRPEREYSFTVTTVLENGTQSMPVSTSVCTKSHFVVKHCFALIQRVVSVETVADALLEKRMLQYAQYDEILAEKVSSAQMRLLYKFTRAWGNSEKDVFFEILKEQQPHLIKDLQGD